MLLKSLVVLCMFLNISLGSPMQNNGWRTFNDSPYKEMINRVYGDSKEDYMDMVIAQHPPPPPAPAPAPEAPAAPPGMPPPGLLPPGFLPPGMLPPGPPARPPPGTPPAGPPPGTPPAGPPPGTPPAGPPPGTPPAGLPPGMPMQRGPPSPSSDSSAISSVDSSPHDLRAFPKRPNTKSRGGSGRCFGCF